MKHIVRTFNENWKVLYEEAFHTAERAYEEYVHNIAILRNRLPKGETISIARYNDGYLMTMETIVGTK